MRIEDVKEGGGFRMVTYDNAAQVAEFGKSKYSQWYHKDASDNWFGGSYQSFLDKAKRGDADEARKADKYVEQFANLAIEDYAYDLDYNTQVGVLDYHAAAAGNPACMFGPSVDLTEKSPVHIYIDTWTSCTVSTRAMEMRGVAVLALAMALTVFRPVMVKMTTGLRHSPTRLDMLQIVDVPTAPMDLSMAAWMLVNPTMFRRGLLGNVWATAKSDKPCGVPRPSSPLLQPSKMPEWLGAQYGVKDVVFLAHMMGGREWDSEEYVLSWIKTQLARFLPQPN